LKRLRHSILCVMYCRCMVYSQTGQDLHCHACGANGDIFTFVQRMDNCSFKDAFKRLGGSYEAHTDYQHRLAQYKVQKRKEKAIQQEQKERRRKDALLEDIKLNKIFEKCFPVFSDDWCEAVNRLFYDFEELDEIISRR